MCAVVQGLGGLGPGLGRRRFKRRCVDKICNLTPFTCGEAPVFVDCVRAYKICNLTPLHLLRTCLIENWVKGALEHRCLLALPAYRHFHVRVARSTHVCVAEGDILQRSCLGTGTRLRVCRKSVVIDSSLHSPACTVHTGFEMFGREKDRG